MHIHAQRDLGFVHESVEHYRHGVNCYGLYRAGVRHVAEVFDYRGGNAALSERLKICQSCIPDLFHAAAVVRRAGQRAQMHHADDRLLPAE